MLSYVASNSKVGMQVTVLKTRVRVLTYIRVKSVCIQKPFEAKNVRGIFWRMWSGVEINVSRYRGKSGLFQ
jgi:hypothetical protein